MVIVGGARPEADGVDRRGIRPVFALGGEFGLMAVDPRLVIGAVDAGNAIKRVVLRDRSADEATLEDVRAADRRTIRLHRRVRLLAVERLGGIKQIRIAWDTVVAGLAAIGVGVEREIAAAGIEQDAAIDTAVDRTNGRSRFNGGAGRGLRARQRRLGRQTIGLERRGPAYGQGVRDTVVGRANDAADRCRSVAQRGRTADDLDLVCRQCIDRHGMIFAEIGGAASTGAVFEDADAIDVETPDDRPA